MPPLKKSNTNTDLKAAARVFDTAMEGIQALEKALDKKFIAAVDLIYGIKGRVIISGMGKSGHVARKIAATLASTGTPSHFVHPGEASHGDLGMITPDDVLILLSNSGETAELMDMINYAKRYRIPLIGMVRRKTSTLVAAADIAFVLPEIPEASPIGAPTTSTTMMMVWGDALAMALLERRGFSKQDFGRFHPGGKLGSQFLKVAALMKKGRDIPIVQEDETMSVALIEITEKSLGCTVVEDKKGKLAGIITDGDLRRHMSPNLVKMKASAVMTKKPKTISPDMLATEAMGIMSERKITTLLVAENSKIVGILHIHDLLRAGIQ